MNCFGKGAVIDSNAAMYDDVPEEILARANEAMSGSAAASEGEEAEDR